jgi:leader peptidase (prepilin peptidase) / N-methyltransferase
VVSWVAQRGRCRHCGVAIGWTSPVVELTCGGLFVGLAVRFGDSAALVAYLIAAAGLIAVALAELRGSGVPLVILVPVTGAVVVALAIAAAVDGDWEPLERALTAGAAAGTAVVLGRLARPAILRPEHAVLAALLGVLTGWISWTALVVGVLLGAGLVAVARLVGGPRPTPLVAPLALGVLVAVLL